MSPKVIEYNATITSRSDLTDKLAIFKIRPDQQPPSHDQFTSGQYAVLGANNASHPEKGSVKRAYSIASAPHQIQEFEFYIRYVDHPASNNPLTHLLWDMKIGSRLWIGQKITGHFTLEHHLNDDDDRLIIFIAAGTGIAPFLSMLRSAKLNAQTGKEFVLLHGVSYSEDLGYRKELESLQQDLNLRYIPTISRPDSNWQGMKGRAESHLLPQGLSSFEQAIGREVGFISPQRCSVFACGLQGTIEGAILGLLERGFIPNEKRIQRYLASDRSPSLFFEPYDSGPIIDLDKTEKKQAIDKAYQLFLKQN